MTAQVKDDQEGQILFGNQSQYAEHRGCTQACVSQWNKKKWLVHDPEGRIDFERSDFYVDGKLRESGSATAKPLTGPKPNSNVVDLKTWQAIETQERARIRRLEREELEGSLINRAEYEEALTSAYTDIRQTLLGLPAQSAKELAECDDPRVVEQILEELIGRALSDLAESGGVADVG